MNEKNEIILFENQDVKLEVNLKDETVWLNLEQMTELFKRDKSVISRHISNIFKEKELEKNSTVANFATVQNESGRTVTRNIDYYNLDVIISVGYRVKSKEGIKFRQWANKLIREYLIKGYNLNVDHFKNNSGGVYFEEVLEKIRDIRSSEKVFWRKILDIYATSIDYDAKNEKTREFFKTVQNKMHYAVHKNTSAEVIFNRVDSEKENIVLTYFKGNMPTRAETEIA